VENHTIGPVSQQERVQSIDVLRGFAVLGILIMNIQSFAMIKAAYLNPHSYGDLNGINYAVWLLSHLLADHKFMSIFSMLFGAGVVLMAERREASGRTAASVHYRRMILLLGFGIAHGFLLWYGDILHAYAVCGLLIFLLRRRSPKALLIIGFILIALPSALSMFWQATIPYWPPEAMVEVNETWWQPSETAVTEEVETYRGGWTEQQSYRSSTALFMQTNRLFTEVIWRAGGLMLVGMALFKLGIFSARASTRTYLWLVAIGLFVGLPVVQLGVYYRDKVSWDITQAFFGGSQLNYWASIAVALGYVGLVMLACQLPAATWMTRPLADVGQMALTCYLGQTIICTTIFYGHGLGLFGSMARSGQILVVAGVWLLMLVACPLWLRYFRFGPFEWLWRCLTYMRIQPLRVTN
jgi:uncharacterized protein